MPRIALPFVVNSAERQKLQMRPWRLMPLLLFMLCALLLTQPILAHAAAGVIELVSGEVRLSDARGQTREAKVGGAIHRGDRIATGEESEIHLRLSDASVLALRPSSQMTLTAYRHRGRESDTSVVALTVGALRSISGWIGRRQPDAVRIKTPTATIGIRGTDHETYVLPAGSPLGEAGTYDKVNHGATFIETAHGRIDLTPGQAGYAAPDRLPVVLPSVPNFFRPTAHEERLEERHERLTRQTASGPSVGTGNNGAAANGAKHGGKSNSGISLQGNTKLNAHADKLNAIAVGSENNAGNRVGAMGGK